jgi:aminoglycoside phosphotransferase (APT) family kinase protein
VVHRRPVDPSRYGLDGLRFFEAAGWTGAPRLLSSEATGTQQVTFLPGRVPWAQPTPAWAVTEDALHRVAQLVREFHDLTAATPLAGDGEVLCHHDLAPNNTVYRQVADGGQPYAFIDWDRAGPGRRIEDVAHVCWTWLDLGPTILDVPAAARRIRLILSAYAAPFGADELVPVIAWWQHRCWRGIEEQAGAGEGAMQQLVADGTAAAIRHAALWTEAHATQLARQT